MGQHPSVAREQEERFRNYNPITKDILVLHEPVDCSNGLNLNSHYIPEEVLLHILSFVDANQLLHCSRVCIKWYNLIKSSLLWKIKYERECKKTAKHYPWYIYYSYFATDYWDKNLIMNPNGEEKFKHWRIFENSGNKWTVECPPLGCKPLPAARELGKSCFTTSYDLCSKLQYVDFENNRLMLFILTQHTPSIYVSDWYTGRFDCSSEYRFQPCLMGGQNVVYAKQDVIKYIKQDLDPDWEKIEHTFSNYAPGVNKIMFFHAGKDSRYWAGHYGSKMAGSVCKLVFDSIKCSNY